MSKHSSKSSKHLKAVVLRSRILRASCLLAWLLLGGAVCAQTQRPTARIDLDQAIQLAMAHDHALKAAQMLIQESRAQEITAAIRPNPVLSWDYAFLPIFSPANFGLPVQQNPLPEQFDAGIGYTFERGHKRQARIQAARDQTAVTRLEVSDTERALTLNVAQQFLAALLARSNLEFARQDLGSFQQTVNVSEARYKAGDISEGDYLKIKLQLLQFETDVSSAELALVQSLASLRQLLGYDAVPADYDVAGELGYTPLRLNQQDLQALALKQRPDVLAAQQGVTAAQSQYRLAKANGKRDLTSSFQFSHVTGVNAGDFAFNIELPIFNRNQGEIARTRYAITQSQESASAAAEAALTEVTNAYQGVKTNEKVVQLYLSGYLKQAQDSRDISEYAYTKGAASLLDFLDAERSYRANQLAYRQALANYMLTVEQLKATVGTRTLSP